MPPIRFFKYHPFSEYALDALERSALWFSAPARFNDPFDCALSVEKSPLEDEDFEQLLLHELAGPREAQVRLLCGNQGHRNPQFRECMTRAIREAFAQQRDNQHNSRGVACLSEQPDNLLMWAHYADMHRGFCLEFDATAEPFRNAVQVLYSDDVPVVNPVPLLDPVNRPPKDYTSAALLTKSSHWSHEREWRLVDVEVNVLRKYDPTSLISIYLGCRAAPERVEQLRAFADVRRVKCYQMRQSASRFELESIAL